MPLRSRRPTSPGRRFQTVSDFSEITRDRPERSLLAPRPGTGGRNNLGRKTARHRGGGHKRQYRIVDFRRDKDGVPATVAAIEYDPNRNARIALLHYADGEKRYILAPAQVRVGDKVQSGQGAEIRPGNSLPLRRRDRPANPPFAGQLRLRRRQRRRHAQVLGGGVLHHARRVDPGPQRRATGRGRRLGRARPGLARRRAGHHRDLHRYAPARRRPHRYRHRPVDADGRRFMARGDDRDPDLLDLLSSGEPIGARVWVRSFGFGNRVTTTRARMDELFPPAPAVLRDRYEHVVVRRDGHLLEVTINRPEARNALHTRRNDELDPSNAFVADDDLWVAIITGAGEAAFSAGNDLVYSASGKPMCVPNGFAGLTSRPHLPKPVIAAVNGYAMGGGCEIALACHLIVADATAQFALSEVKVGLVAGAGGLIRLPRTVPPKVATEMILTGRRITADEALGYGLVNRVVSAGAALDGARGLAAEILAGSPTSVRISLQIMEETRGIPDVARAVSYHSSALDDLMSTQDAAEGPAAFAAKRRPQWRNW